ncbi:MAG: SDR family oxidoreductase [Synechococcaceae bacterium WB9_4xC_028]|nr:SDR family oxidoreductase [Synechococcaceae bacterium WB9_4xC_028]
MLDDLVNRCPPLPPDATLLVLGAGFSGSHLAALARRQGARVLTTRRLPDESDLGSVLRFDSQLAKHPDPEQLNDVTHVLSTIPPERNGQDPVLRCLGEQLQQLPLQWVGYLSTTGVYGDRQGGWVQESDPAKPTQERSQRRLACEQAWLESGLPVQILRLPGIYGPDRSPLRTISRGELQPIDKPNQVFCRIHVDDIAGACLHLIERAAQGQRPEIVNISDNEPAPSATVQRHAASLLGVAIPEPKPYSEASIAMSAMARSFWAENRRVSNHLLCQELGYTLLHPDFRSGLLDCLKVEGFRAAVPSADQPPPTPERPESAHSTEPASPDQ